MYRTISKYIITVIIVFGISTGLFGQSLVNIGVKLGGSKLLGEIPKGNTTLINEFYNKTGFAFALEISKYISPKWEIGVDFVNSNLRGTTNYPEFSAEGLQGGIPSEINDPVEYQNKLMGQNIYFRYFFRPYTTESYFIPFVKAGGGYLDYTSKFKYIDAPDDDLLFGKGKEGYTDLSTPLFVFGAGVKSAISPNIYVITSVDINMVSYDFLDVVHNYGDDNIRQQITGVFTEFKIGIFYTIKNPNAKEKKDKKNESKNKKGGAAKSSYLPFSPIKTSR